jgi:hypothetical protein
MSRSTFSEGAWSFAAGSFEAASPSSFASFVDGRRSSAARAFSTRNRFGERHERRHFPGARGVAVEEAQLVLQARAQQRGVDPALDAEFFKIDGLELREPDLIELPQARLVDGGARHVVEALYFTAIGGETFDEFAQFAGGRRDHRRDIRDIIRGRAGGGRIGLSGQDGAERTGQQGEAENQVRHSNDATRWVGVGQAANGQGGASSIRQRTEGGTQGGRGSVRRGSAGACDSRSTFSSSII